MDGIQVPCFTALPASAPPWPGVVVVMEGGGIAQHLGTVRCPLLALFGGRDEWIPRTDVAKVEEHHPGAVIVYEDAEHGFMRDGSEAYHETAATDAWQRMLAFFAQHLEDR